MAAAVTGHVELSIFMRLSRCASSASYSMRLSVSFSLPRISIRLLKIGVNSTANSLLCAENANNENKMCAKKCEPVQRSVNSSLEAGRRFECELAKYAKVLVNLATLCVHTRLVNASVCVHAESLVCVCLVVR